MWRLVFGATCMGVTIMLSGCGGSETGINALDTLLDGVNNKGSCCPIASCFGGIQICAGSINLLSSLAILLIIGGIAVTMIRKARIKNNIKIGEYEAKQNAKLAAIQGMSRRKAENGVGDEAPNGAARETSEDMMRRIKLKKFN